MILISIKACKKISYHYICSNLNITPFTNNKVDIENFLINKIDHYNNFQDDNLGLLKMHSYQLDLLFRVIYSNLNDLKNDLELEDIKNYLVLLDWYIDDYNTNKLVGCYK